MNKFVRLFADPYWAFGVMLQRIFSRLITDDRLYIKLDYFSGMKRFPDLEHPKTFNEKLQWLKLNDKHEEYTRLVDKYEVKKYVSGILGEDVIIPTLGVWDKFEEMYRTVLTKEPKVMSTAIREMREDLEKIDRER